MTASWGLFVLFYYLLQRQKPLTLIENKNQSLTFSRSQAQELLQSLCLGALFPTATWKFNVPLFHPVSCLHPVCQNERNKL